MYPWQNRRSPAHPQRPAYRCRRSYSQPKLPPSTKITACGTFSLFSTFHVHSSFLGHVPVVFIVTTAGAKVFAFLAFHARLLSFLEFFAAPLCTFFLFFV